MSVLPHLAETCEECIRGISLEGTRSRIQRGFLRVNLLINSLTSVFMKLGCIVYTAMREVTRKAKNTDSRRAPSAGDEIAE